MFPRINDVDRLRRCYGGTERAVLRIAGISGSAVLGVGEAAINTGADTLSVAFGKGKRIHCLAAGTLRTGNETAKACHDDGVPFSCSSMKTAPSSGLWQ